MVSKKQIPIAERFSSWVIRVAGSTMAFSVACLLVVAWAITGPYFHYSENWQLVINTSTTIITFLMVFLIQRAQNKDALAIQLKLNELVAANSLASNRLVNVEDLTEEELKVIKKYYLKLHELAFAESTLTESHTVEEEASRLEKELEKTNQLREDLKKTATEIKADQKEVKKEAQELKKEAKALKKDIRKD